jgi:hypothetical protein
MFLKKAQGGIPAIKGGAIIPKNHTALKPILSCGNKLVPRAEKENG